MYVLNTFLYLYFNCLTFEVFQFCGKNAYTANSKYALTVIHVGEHVTQ